MIAPLAPDDTVAPAPPTPSPDTASGRPTSLAPLAVLLGSLCALVASRPLKDNSFLTHLATGRLILSDGVPSENPFLFTGTDFPVPSWWWSIVLGAVEELGGAGAIRLLTAATAGALGVVLVLLSRSTTSADASEPAAPPAGLLQVVLPVVLTLVCVFEFLNGRPHLPGFLLLAAAVLVWKDERSPWWQALIFLIWVNVHGSWLYGALVLAALAVARAVDDRRIRPRDLQGVGAAVAGLVLGGAVYPQAFEILLLPTRQFGDPLEREALSAYQEWAPVPFDEPIAWALAVMALLAAWSCVRSRRWASTALVVGLTVMAFSSIRLVPIAAITMLPFAASGLARVGSMRVPAGPQARVAFAVGAVLAVATVGFSATGPHYNLGPYPVDAVDWLEDRGLAGNDEVRLVSHDYVGNYLEWRYGVDANAYVDDRPDARTLIDYRMLNKLLPGWQDALGRAQPDVLLWSTEQPLVEELSGDPDWHRAVDLGEFAVFCRAELADRCS